MIIDTSFNQSSLGDHGAAGRVLVIDTSTDYIDHLHRCYPGRALFVTDPAERQKGAEKAPDSASELLVDPDSPTVVIERIRHHLKNHRLEATGVACFDCESMYLSALIAREFGLSYPAPEAVLASRIKFISKERWRRFGLDCPRAEEITTAAQADDFRMRHGGRVVIKPLSGSGSELIFVCQSRAECDSALATMRRRLAAMPRERMYAAYAVPGCSIDPHNVFLAEEFCFGDEYSCDFFIDGDTVRVVRLARKWLKPDPAPGIALAYLVPGRLPEKISCETFHDVLRCAAQALGISRSLCMLDFLVAEERLILLELAPRPGGDCLPQLLRAACGLDILGLELDVAQCLPLDIPDPDRWQSLVGLRLFASRAGIISAIDPTALARDPRVREVRLKCAAGHQVILPPDDYHSRILGYAIFEPGSEQTIGPACLDLLGRLDVRYAEGGPA